MFSFRLKALRALVVVGVVSGFGLASCQNAGQDLASQAVPQSIPQEQDFSLAQAADAKASPMLMSAEEREAKKREFFAKPEVKEMSAGLEEIAQAVAVAVEDKAVRERIYAKCMEKFDGETNVLWQQLDADADLKSRGGWSARVEREANKSRKNAVIKGIGSVDAAIKKFEKVMNRPLHFYWMFPTNWDRKTSPLVAFVPFDVDISVKRNIIAFDSKGAQYTINERADIAQQRPVVVFTFNERTNLDGTLRSGLITSAGIQNQVQAKNGGSLNWGLPYMQVAFINMLIDNKRKLDEFPWDGASEFFCDLDVYRLDQSNNGYYQFWGNIYLGNVYTGSFYPYSGAFPSFPIGNIGNGRIGRPECRINWWEDDAFVGLDMFDDYVGTHYITAPHASIPYSQRHHAVSAGNVEANYRVTIQ